MSLNMMKNMSNTLNKACRKYGDEIVNELSRLYKFDADEAKRQLNLVEEKPKKSSKPKKEKFLKPSVVLPYCGKENENACNVVKVNHQLYTQCTNAKQEGGDCCKTCGKKDAQFGTIGDRKSNSEFETKYRVKIASYGNVMQKLGISAEEAVKEAEKFGFTIPEEQFEVRKTQRGRPKKSVIVSDSDDETKPKKQRGRPKKEKKLVSSLNPGDDLIATLVAKAAEETSSSEDEVQSEEEKVEQVEEKPKKKRAPKKTAEEKEAEKEEKRLKKEAEKEAKKAEKEAEKEAKKAEKEAEKEAKKAEKEAEKEAKKAEKEAEKEAKKAEKEAEKKSKKAEKEAEKKSKKDLSVDIPEVDEKIEVKSAEELKEEEIDDEIVDLNEVIDSDSEDEETTEVQAIECEGKKYLKAEDNTIYDVETQEPIGEWLVDEDRVALYESEV